MMLVLSASSWAGGYLLDAGVDLGRVIAGMAALAVIPLVLWLVTLAVWAPPTIAADGDAHVPTTPIAQHTTGENPPVEP
jgi:hypothetical protein